MTATAKPLKRMDIRYAFLSQNGLTKMNVSVSMYSENELNIRLLIVGEGLTSYVIGMW